jgi:uncharacterized protein YfaS (alpha-2-macroglobulin family)
MQYSRITFLVLFLYSLSQCSDNKKNLDSDVALFSPYINGFTSGFVSASSDIEIELAFAKADWQPNQELDCSLFDISPSVKGKVIALANNRVAFKPSEKLKQGTQYHVKFKLNDCIKVPKDLAEFRFTLNTFKQDFNVNIESIQSYSPDWYYLKGVLKTSDNLDFATASRLVSATFLGKSLHIKMDEKASTSLEFRFIIDSIARQESETSVNIKWDGNKYDIDQKGEGFFDIPSKNSFQVVRTVLSNDGSGALLINFSEPVKRDQNFDGLVSIESAQNLSFATEGNLLKVFYENGISGSLKVEIFQGIESEYGKKLEKNFVGKFSFEEQKPAVEFVKSGTILPSSNNLSIHFKATTLRAVDVKVYRIFENNILQFLQVNTLNGNSNLRNVALPIAKKTLQLKTDNLKNYNQWNTYTIDLSALILPEQGAIYRTEISFKKEYSLYRCEQDTTDEGTSENEDEIDEEADFTSEYDYYDYGYDWEERENPCSKSYYYGKHVATNVLATDIGVIAKRGNDNSFKIIVNDIISTAPVSSASVEIYNYQQQKLGSYKTNGDGIADFTLDTKPFFAVIKKDKSTTYIKLEEGYSQSVSNFNVDGELVQKGMKGYIYGERGVWRPGDTLFLAFILNDLAAKLPAKHPIKLRLNDPSGKTIYQSVQNYQVLNHYKFIVPTAMSAPTGNWEAVVSVGGAKFYKSIKIETIKPNRLKIKNSLADKFLYPNAKTEGSIAVTWLHGAVAKDLKVEAQAKLSHTVTTFPSFKNYVFDNPATNFSTEEINLFAGKVNDLGIANFVIPSKESSNEPGMLKAAIITKVYENGGDFSTDVVSATYSPFSTYVGFKTPELSQYGMLETEKLNRFDVVSVNEMGQTKPGVKLNVKVYRIDWRWWWDGSSDDLSSYTTSTNYAAYFETKTTTDANGKSHFSFKVNESDWGRFLILVTDEKGGHTTGKTVFIDWPTWSAKSKNDNAANANMLIFSTDKKTYNVGETAHIAFSTSAGCRALISLETGSSVLETKWVETTTGETKVSLPIKENMSPNVYIHITLLQPHSFSKNDLPIRLYGIMPIEVINKQTILEPQIAMPAVLRPEANASITVSEKSGKEMSYTLAIVDEGLLDLTRFKTPNAWTSFYAKEALGVRTWDVYDDIIGAFGGAINQIFSIGGDADLGGGKAKKANRFKPVVSYFGPFKLTKGSKITHTVKLPNYIGSVKVMVVAANAETAAYGSSEKIVPVKSPLMLLASFPRKVSPGEKITLPVTLFAMEPQIKNVSLQLKSNNLFAILSGASQKISFTQPDEKMAYIEMQAKDISGIGKIELIATAGNEKATYTIEVDVVNPNPVSYQISEAMLPANGTVSIDWKSFGVKGSNKAILELSTMPPINLTKRINYLIQYPHGCIEQTTSSAFPQLYLADIMDVNDARKSAIQRNVSATIQRLLQFQVSTGGFAYWPGQSMADDWGTSYAGHFLIEAEKKGYAVPQSMKKNWLSHQRKMAKEWRPNAYQNDFAQAYRLYTMVIAGSPDVASMNRLRETKSLSEAGKLRLALCYALIGQKNMANSLFATAHLTNENDQYFYYGSEDRNRAMVLETLLFLGRNSEALNTATKLAKNLSSDVWMSTQTTAYSLMAIANFGKYMGGKEIEVSYVEGGVTKALKSNKMILEQSLTSSGVISLKNKKENLVFARIISSGILPVGEEIEEEKGLQVTVAYFDNQDKLFNISEIKQGTTFKCKITVLNPGRETVENIALSSIVPSGWEIINTRYSDAYVPTENQADYIDIRDDRTLLYFSLKNGESRTFAISLNASYLGRYYLPGLQCEAMYDHNFFVHKKGQWIAVVK